jgi:NADP-dependent 3-hydroxy acid dehydrogenase YdfG
MDTMNIPSVLAGGAAAVALMSCLRAAGPEDVSASSSLHDRPASASASAPSAPAPSGRMAGKTAVITGAAHGIAKATATLFAAEGCHVVLADRDATAGEHVAALLRARGHDATFIECDVSQEAAVRSLMATAGKLGGGRFDALVNVAGVDIIAKLEDTTLARWERALSVNLTSAFLTCSAALPYLKAAGRSSIVNISSIQASRGFSGYPAYGEAPPDACAAAGSVARVRRRQSW